MIRILLADDQKSIRETLRIRLEAEEDFEIVGTASDGHTTVELAEILRPDLVLLDMEMPGINGVEVTRMICQALPEVKILVLSAHNDDRYVKKAIQAGAVGYLLKSIPASELREAIRFVQRGYTQLSPGVLNKVVANESDSVAHQTDEVDLSVLTNGKLDAPPAPVSRKTATAGALTRVDLENTPSTPTLSAEQEKYQDSDGWGLDLLGILRRRWLPAAAALGTMMATVVVYTFLIEEPTYRSEMWIQLSNRSSVSVSSLPEEQVEGPEEDVSKGRITEVQILQSSPLLAKAIAQLPQAYQEEISTSDLKSNLSITQAEEDGLLSNVLIADYTDTDPKRVQTILETLGKVYVNYSAERMRSRATSAIKFIEENLPATRATLSKANAAVREFRKRYGMVNPETYAEDLGKTKLALANDIRQAEIALKQSSSRLQSQQLRLQSLGQNPESAPLSAVLGQDEGYQSLARQLRDVQVQLNVQQTTLGMEHPTIQNLREQQARLLALSQNRARGVLGNKISENLAATTPYSIGSTVGSTANSAGQSSESNSMLNNLSAQLLQAQTDVETQQAQLASLRQAQATVESRFKQLPKLQENYGELQRQVKLHSERLEKLLQQLQELRIAAAQETTPWTILEPAALPKKPISPNIVRNLLFGLIFSGVVGLGVAFLLERLDRRVKSLKEATELTGLPLLGVIPLARLEPERQQDGSAFFTDYHCYAFETAFRSLALHLQQSVAHGKSKLLMFTSAQPGEGKSTVTYELGLTLARLGLNVLLVDADMYTPSLHLHSRLSNVKGLSNLVGPEADWHDCIQPGEVASLDILLSGPQSQDSFALLRSEKMTELLQQWRQAYDYVLIDTPALTHGIDAQSLAAKVDATILVLGLELVTKPAVLRAMNLLTAERHQFIGLVVNRLSVQGTEYAAQQFLPAAEMSAFHTAS
jgi:polysaccharide biosynthesis transport protein